MHWTQISIHSSFYNYEYFSQEDVCRLCWNRNAEEEIFSQNKDFGTETSLLKIIKDYLQIDIDHHVHPNKVCIECCNEIKRFYSFKQFCLETDVRLRKIFQKRLDESKSHDYSSDGIKCEEIDESYDKIDDINNYLNDDIGYEEITDKKSKSSSQSRKKYLLKRSPTYCNICCIDLECLDKLSIHNTELHGIENDGTLFKCFGCEKRFKNKKTRISHEVNFCKGLKDGYKCTICNRFLPKRCTYELHMRDHRQNTETELPEHIFKCNKCIKSFKTKEFLRNHILNEHEKEKIFICDICGRVFSRQDYLHKHNLIHKGLKQHQCPHCDFKATQRSSLTVHIRKHTGERPYSCDQCPQRCISSSNLRAHRRRHLGLKKYECNLCSKKFGYKISLEEHISSTHVRSESHPCEHCGAT